MKKYYIAYGSNLNVQQMRYRCPGARVVGISSIRDYELLYKGSKTGSYLTIEKKKGSVVPVAVWEVTADDEKRLDAYEGFPNFYYKKNIFDILIPLRKSKTPECSVFRLTVHLTYIVLDVLFYQRTTVNLPPLSHCSSPVETVKNEPRFTAVPQTDSKPPLYLMLQPIW